MPSRRVPVPGSSRAILKGLVVVAWSSALLALGRLANQYISMGSRSPLCNNGETKLLPRPSTGRLVAQRAEWSYGSSSKLELLDLYDTPSPAKEEEEDASVGIATMGVLLFAAGALLSISSFLSNGTPPADVASPAQLAAGIAAVQEAPVAASDFRTAMQPFVPLAVGVNLTALSFTLAAPKAEATGEAVEAGEPGPVAVAAAASKPAAAVAAAPPASTAAPEEATAAPAQASTPPATHSVATSSRGADKPKLVKLSVPANTTPRASTQQQEELRMLLLNSTPAMRYV